VGLAYNLTDLTGSDWWLWTRSFKRN